ncbi:hypothetical protein KC332_g14693 [Hortaea werneckii]|nr:hypothetical protein KC358_g14746 [Hortaea werneckii]KAI6805760.1 hypothetical protein KC350_g14455 [Hortaea werneckii]KAI6824781.1 hypothetical protein KC342_g11388 [Hortaea werneckii]KAI6906384.1 hypothetical protein KC348_g14667 [Hortaea werneckii]KAI6923801.1 hypothetical protein KC341_g14474 [Hortaea werneckii]
MEIATNPIFHPTKPCKILVSPGHGAGWVTYAPRTAPDAFRAWMLTFEPLVVALERKGVGGGSDSPEEALAFFHHQAKLRFNIDRLMLARVQDLFVLEIPSTQGAFEIREVDGRETVWDVSRRRDVVVPPSPMSSTTTTGAAEGGELAGKVAEEKMTVGKGIPVEMSAPLKGVGSTPAASAGSVVSLGLSSAAAAAGTGNGVSMSGGRGVK